MVITPEEVLVTKEKFSRTTSKHLNQFLGNLKVDRFLEQNELELLSA